SCTSPSMMTAPPAPRISNGTIVPRTTVPPIELPGREAAPPGGMCIASAARRVPRPQAQAVAARPAGRATRGRAVVAGLPEGVGGGQAAGAGVCGATGVTVALGDGNHGWTRSGGAGCGGQAASVSRVVATPRPLGPLERTRGPALTQRWGYRGKGARKPGGAR